MKTINLYEKFDFDAFMQYRGWSTLLSLFVWIVLMAMIVFKTFNP